MRSFRAVGQSHPATGRSPSGCGTSVSLPTGRGPRPLVQVRRSRFDVDGGAPAAVWTLSGVLSALTSDWPKQSWKCSSSRSCPPVLCRHTMSRCLLLVLVLATAVTSQIIIPEDGRTEVKAGAEEDHVSVLLQQLEKERELRGRDRPADRLQLHTGQLQF